MGVFDDIKTGLEQAISHEKGRLPAKKTEIRTAPDKKSTSDKIKELSQSREARKD